ncbi:hypothetical protein [Nannocystis punicea]|uniref:Secreted protein n=1 Tax=Nannocystis punicea TaxID=2995304 RepID=A0ABY7H2F3_9BACT|nr:hypothetical protein [Nannocystis poenicansa]WAS93431.1 hypothetical protein O0S08_45380 [Nannocystis poenicansa]
MTSRVLLLFSLSFVFAACDLPSRLVPDALSITNESAPSMGFTITCCRCAQNTCETMEVNGTECPEGWHPVWPQPNHDISDPAP